MLNIKKSALALGFGIGLTSLYTVSAPQCGSDARCYYQNDRDIAGCMQTGHSRADCEAGYADDLQQCLAGNYDGPGRPAFCD